MSDRRGGIGLFRLLPFGWVISLGMLLFVALVLVVGTIRNDPIRNPPPARYVASVCAAIPHLDAGAQALGEGVDAIEEEDDAARAEAVAAIRTAVDAGNHVLHGLPAWAPGERFDELLGATIITLVEGADAVERDDLEGGQSIPGARDRLAVAEGLVADAETVFAEERYGFSC